MISINQIKMVQVCDNFLTVGGRIDSRVWTYHTSLLNFYKGYEDFQHTPDEVKLAITEHVEAITLIGRTARTNVMIRDSKGRFVSYKNAEERIRDAVASLKAFPEALV